MIKEELNRLFLGLEIRKTTNVVPLKYNSAELNA